MARTILVVDDDPDCVLQLRTQLEAAGFDVITADGVREAIAVLETSRPDLAIVDLMLEHADSGFELCYHIKKLDPAIPVLIVTGVAGKFGITFDASTDEERSWVKADVVLDKPVRPEQLRREIGRLLKE
jgi:two-component system, OmpR family, response regulator